MTDKQVVECIDNSWRALACIYTKHPDNSTRIAMNIVSRIIGKVKSEVDKSHKKKEESGREGQLSIEDWIAFLSEED